MTTQDDDEEPFDQRAYTGACVSTAFKRYTRTRRIKMQALAVVAFIATVVPWLSDEARTVQGFGSDHPYEITDINAGTIIFRAPRKILLAKSLRI